MHGRIRGEERADACGIDRGARKPAGRVGAPVAGGMVEGDERVDPGRGGGIHPRRDLRGLDAHGVVREHEARGLQPERAEARVGERRGPLVADAGDQAPGRRGAAGAGRRDRAERAAVADGRAGQHAGARAMVPGPRRQEPDADTLAGEGPVGLPGQDPHRGARVMAAAQPVQGGGGQAQADARDAAGGDREVDGEDADAAAGDLAHGHAATSSRGFRGQITATRPRRNRPLASTRTVTWSGPTIRGVPGWTWGGGGGFSGGHGYGGYGG